MNYKLQGTGDVTNILETVLNNRGIDDWKKYLNLDKSVVQDYNYLNNMQEAVECFVKHYEQKNKIMIMPDEDCDGYTSSAMLWLYIKALDPDYPIEYVLHSLPKKHGLVDVDLSKFNDAKLIIIADASTNDTFQCNKLIEKGIDVIILDHHDENYSDESDNETDYQMAKYNKAIIVNNQLSPNYKNKNLSGAGIVYRYLQALDDALWEYHADDVIDLCCVGNIGDMMDVRSFETRYFIEQGILSFNNNFLLALAKAQEFSTKGIINIHNISWSFCPVINAVTRIGTYEERDLLFKAMTDQYDEFDYKKRDGTVIREDIYDRAVRVAKSIKSRQDRMRDAVFNELANKVSDADKVIMLRSAKAQDGITGVSCIKIANTFKRPTIILNEIDINGNKVLSGSCRNCDNSPIGDFKELILQTKAFEFCSGHANAAGLSILPENVNIAKEAFEKLLVDIDFDNSIACDFVLNVNDIGVRFIQEIDSLKDLWGTNLKEPYIAIENITINKDDINLYGKNMDTISFMVNDIKFIQFKAAEGDCLYDFICGWDSDETITINAVVKCSINNYNAVLTPQCEIVMATVQN